MARVTRRFTHPDSYLPKEGAAAVLREIADEIERSSDARWVSLKIERRWAKPEEIEFNRKRLAATKESHQ